MKKLLPLLIILAVSCGGNDKKATAPTVPHYPQIDLGWDCPDTCQFFLGQTLHFDPVVNDDTGIEYVRYFANDSSLEIFGKYPYSYDWTPTRGGVYRFCGLIVNLRADSAWDCVYIRMI